MLMASPAVDAQTSATDVDSVLSEANVSASQRAMTTSAHPASCCRKLVQTSPDASSSGHAKLIVASGPASDPGETLACGVGNLPGDGEEPVDTDAAQSAPRIKEPNGDGIIQAEDDLTCSGSRDRTSSDPGADVDVSSHGCKLCNLCEQNLPTNRFRRAASGRVESYCTDCSRVVQRGRARGLGIDSLRAAMQDGTLSTVLRRDASVPEGHKICRLCDAVKSLDMFKIASRGGRESYCIVCNKLVRRGIKQGLHIDAVRFAFKNGKLETLLRPESTAARFPCAEGHKRCNLCDKEQPLDNFCTTGSGRQSYCRPCERLVQRGRNRGFHIKELREAYHNNTIDQLLPVRPVQSARARLFPDTPIPEGMKVCNLCEETLPMKSFKHKYDGSLCSYCDTCDHLVGRGRRRNLSMETMRAALREGTLQTLLAQAVPQTAGGKAPIAPTKKCNLCSQELPTEIYRVVSGGGRCSYCPPCERLVGAGRRRGMPIADLRTAYRTGTLSAVLGMQVQPVLGSRALSSDKRVAGGSSSETEGVDDTGEDVAAGGTSTDGGSPCAEDSPGEVVASHAGVLSLLQAAAAAASQVAREQQPWPQGDICSGTGNGSGAHLAVPSAPAAAARVGPAAASAVSAPASISAVPSLLSDWLERRSARERADAVRSTKHIRTGAGLRSSFEGVLHASTWAPADADGASEAQKHGGPMPPSPPALLAVPTVGSGSAEGLTWHPAPASPPLQVPPRQLFKGADRAPPRQDAPVSNAVLLQALGAIQALVQHLQPQPSLAGTPPASLPGGAYSAGMQPSMHTSAPVCVRGTPWSSTVQGARGWQTQPIQAAVDSGAPGGHAALGGLWNASPGVPAGLRACDGQDRGGGTEGTYARCSQCSRLWEEQRCVRLGGGESALVVCAMCLAAHLQSLGGGKQG